MTGNQVSAVVSISRESLKSIKGMIEKRKKLREAEVAFEEATNEAKQQLARAVKYVKAVATGTIKEEYFRAEYCGLLDDVAATATIEDALESVLSYGFFQGETYNFSEEDDAEVQLHITCEALPRLSHIARAGVSAYDPLADELHLVSSLNWYDDPDQDQEKSVKFSIRLTDGLSQAVIVNVTGW